jgi:hypothetical protein
MTSNELNQNAIDQIDSILRSIYPEDKEFGTHFIIYQVTKQNTGELKWRVELKAGSTSIPSLSMSRHSSRVKALNSLFARNSGVTKFYVVIEPHKGEE